MRYERLIVTCWLAFCLVTSAFAQSGVSFVPVKACIDDMAGMQAAMKAVTTAQQAAQFSVNLKAHLPEMVINRQRLAATVTEYGRSRSKTAEILQADSLWQEAMARRPAMETEMARLEKLNVGLADLFQTVRALLQ